MKKKYLSPFEGRKLYALVKTVIAGDARLKMRTVVDTSRNAGAVMTDVGPHGTYVQEIDLTAEAYGFNVEWNGEFKSVAEIEAMLKPAMDVMQKWCDERDGLLDIVLGCTLYNHDVAKLPEARKVKALQTGRLCARFRYAKEYIDGLKKAQKKKKLHESGLLSGQAAYERMRQGEKPLVPSFVLKTNGGTILVPVDMTLDELIGWNDRLGKGDVSSIKVVSKTDPKKLKESGIVLNVDDPADAAKIGGKQNAKAVIVKYDGKFHVNNRYDSVSGRLWLDERPFDTERAASDYRDYLNSHGDY